MPPTWVSTCCCTLCKIEPATAARPMPLTLHPDGGEPQCVSRGFPLGKRAGLHRRLCLAAQSGIGRPPPEAAEKVATLGSVVQISIFAARSRREGNTVGPRKLKFERLTLVPARNPPTVPEFQQPPAGAGWDSVSTRVTMESRPRLNRRKPLAEGPDSGGTTTTT